MTDQSVYLSRDIYVCYSQVRHDPIELLKKKFMAACYSYKGDWITMFKKMDKDGSGDLDIDEFKDALRFEAKISTDILPDEDILDVFKVRASVFAVVFESFCDYFGF